MGRGKRSLDALSQHVEAYAVTSVLGFGVKDVDDPAAIDFEEAVVRSGRVGLAGVLWNAHVFDAIFHGSLHTRFAAANASTAALELGRRCLHLRSVQPVVLDQQGPLWGAVETGRYGVCCLAAQRAPPHMPVVIWHEETRFTVSEGSCGTN